MNQKKISFDPEYRPDGISVVIPNYNGVELFRKTLTPLLSALNNTKLPWEVIVVDDCSTDNSVFFLKEHFPWISILINEQNQGFSKTINRGIRAAKYELVFLLNSDIILTTDYFNSQLKYFSHPSTFGTSGRIIGWDDNFVQDAARLPAFQLCKLKVNRHYFANDNNPVFSLYLSGANALVNREKLLALNGFNEIFTPFYAEDLDLSVRAWRNGWYCYYEHQAICRHKTSASIKSKEKKKFINKIYYRNKLFFHAIHLSDFELVIYITQIALEAFAKCLLLRPVLLQALVLFLSEQKKWKTARKFYQTGSDKSMTGLTLRQVVKYIKESVKHRNIITFRSGKLELR